MTVVLLVLLLLLVLVNGFFVAAEFAIVRSRQSRIEQMAAEGVRSAKLAATQMDHVDEFVATCQVGSRSPPSASASSASRRSRSCSCRCSAG